MTRAKEKFHPLLSWEVLFRSSFQEWVKDRATRFSAALAYYSIFAMAPLVTIAISIAGLAFGAEAARGQVYDQVHYLGRSSIGSSFGAAGALILVLVWVYYSAMVFFLGAEFTKVYADRYGSGINPGKHARLVNPARHAKDESRNDDNRNARYSSNETANEDEKS